MKKLLAKIAFFTIINLMLIPAVMAAGNPGDAATPGAPPIATDTTAGNAGDAATPGAPPIASPVDATAIYAQTKPCIQEFTYTADPKSATGWSVDSKQPGPDAGYVISIIEEPLGTKDTPLPDGNYVSRTCYRNTFEYTNGLGTRTTLPWLGKTCSAEAQTQYTNNPTNVKYSCKEVQVILTKGGVSGIYGYINMIYRWGASMAGIIAVTVIILSGIQISASGGDPEAIGAGKKRIIKSIVGILILFLSSLILYTVNPTFFTNS